MEGVSEGWRIHKSLLSICACSIQIFEVTIPMEKVIRYLDREITPGGIHAI